MKAKDVLRILNITRPTLSKYVKQGIIKVKTNINGMYNYDEESVFSLINKNKRRKNVIYARVSTNNQKKDLENQINLIKEFCNRNGIIIDEIYSDISSSIYLDRKNFLKLLDDILSYKIENIYITYKDRLSRTSFSMLEKLFERFGTKIIVINNANTSMEKELLEDLISLIHSFSMKMYSNRRKKKLELIEKDLKLEKHCSQDN